MRLSWIVLLGWLLGQVSVSDAEDRAPTRPDFLMDREPAPVAVVTEFEINPRLFPLWQRALGHSESEVRRQAALAVMRAHQLQVDGLQRFLPELVKLVQEDKLHPATRHAAAQALIALNDRESAPILAKVSQQYGPDFHMLIEPALGSWGYEPILSEWTARLTNREVSRRDLLLAIRGLTQNQRDAAFPELLKITESPDHPEDVRLEAARGAGQLASEGLEPNAKSLRSRINLIDRLCAVFLLKTHRSPSAVEILKDLAQDSEPAVAAEALRSLFRIDPQLILPLAEGAFANRDHQVRQVAVEAYLQLVTTERLQRLADLLNDPHPGLRAIVREGYYTHSQNPQYTELVIQLSKEALAGNQWQGQEQACLLLAALNRKESAPRVMELLKSDRDEVMIATGWAMRVFAIPETAPVMISQIKARSQNESWHAVGVTHQIAHLSEALGVLKHREAIPVLKTFIPKTQKYNPLARAGAIYAIGAVLEDTAATPQPKAEAANSSILDKASSLIGLGQKEINPSELAEELEGRMKDVDGMPPEAPQVRRACALALGLMKSAPQIPTMRRLLGPHVIPDPVALAMRWSIHRITGEDLPIVQPGPQPFTGWFLEPNPVTR